MNTPHISATHAADAARWTHSASLPMVLRATFEPFEHTPSVVVRPYPIQQFPQCAPQRRAAPHSDKTLDQARFERYECMRGRGVLSGIDIQALVNEDSAIETSVSTIYKQLELLIRAKIVTKTMLPKRRVAFQWVAA